jgi:CRP-like cAMP-binding protein
MSVHFLPDTRKILLQLKLFQGLRESELDIMLSKAYFIECPAGDYPIREGEQGDHLFVLLAGSARISKRVNRSQKTLQMLGPSECFGEMSLIECRSRSASVMAVTDCKLLRISGEQIAMFPEIATKIYRNIAIMLSQRLRHANEILTLG